MKLELRSVRIKNCGPIDDIKMDFFDARGKTLPVCVIGGANGSGKTTLLEVIAAMAEMLIPKSLDTLDDHLSQKIPEYLARACN
ncbi:MAG: AAA family ATPase [Blastocatellia bacterium]|nr:AAA family ATPase [Blastocatellia bacterium]